MEPLYKLVIPSILPVNLTGVVDSNKPQHGQFYTSPVLWSESIANLSNIYVIDSTHDSSKSLNTFRKANKKLLANSLPMRLSIQSPNSSGLKFAISYAPSGYDENLWNSIDNNKLIEIEKKLKIKTKNLVFLINQPIEQ